MRVVVAYALPHRQWVVDVEVPDDATVGAALEQSGLRGRCAGLDAQDLELAVFGRIVPADTRLRPGDRVEVLRPLKNDPKLARRQRAAQGRSMGPKR